jgi:hypothetical protein
MIAHSCSSSAVCFVREALLDAAELDEVKVKLRRLAEIDDMIREKTKNLFAVLCPDHVECDPLGARSSSSEFLRGCCHLMLAVHLPSVRRGLPPGIAGRSTWQI